MPDEVPISEPHITKPAPQTSTARRSTASGAMSCSRTAPISIKANLTLILARTVTSTDGMTADFYTFDMDFLGRVSIRIVNEVRDINPERGHGSALPRGPRIDHFQTGGIDGEPVRGGDRGDVAIERWKALSGRARTDRDVGFGKDDDSDRRNVLHPIVAPERGGAAVPGPVGGIEDVAFVGVLEPRLLQHGRSDDAFLVDPAMQLLG